MRHTKTTIATAAAGIFAAGCGAASHHTQPVRGHILGGTPAGTTVAAAFGNIHGLCSGATPGTQVIVKGPSGQLLATTTLAGTLQHQVGVLRFATAIPAGHGPYTIDVVGVSSLVVSAGQLAHLHLTCS